VHVDCIGVYTEYLPRPEEHKKAVRTAQIRIDGTLQELFSMAG
jgi:hypothetical protein